MNFRKSNPEADLAAQLDVFDEQYKSDEADRLLEYKNLNLDSPTDIFYAILKQVKNSKIPECLYCKLVIVLGRRHPFSHILHQRASELIEHRR